MRTLLIASLLAGAAVAADFPQAEIASSTIAAKFYLPDAERGYYRGTRFDWSGQIYSLKAGGHEYFGQWFPKYDPKLHDAIMGPVEDFRSEDGSPGYGAAKPGGLFLRPGVGVLRRADDKAFEPFRTYDIVDSGTWKVAHGKDWIRFTHIVKGPEGYAYRYTKTIRLDKREPVMTIEHALKNTGKRALDLEQYNHNFFMLDNAPTGPDTLMEFQNELKTAEPPRGTAAKIDGRRIVYQRELPEGESFYARFAGFDASGYKFRLENARARAGVEITGNQPVAKLVYWSIRTTFCPEAYVPVKAAPGAEARWSYRYRFYSK